MNRFESGVVLTKGELCLVLGILLMAWGKSSRWANGEKQDVPAKAGWMLTVMPQVEHRDVIYAKTELNYMGYLSCSRVILNLYWDFHVS